MGSPWLSIYQSKVARKSLGSPHLQGISEVPILHGLSLEDGDITLHIFFFNVDVYLFKYGTGSHITPNPPWFAHTTF